ncbi:DICT sensory domain-containing protein [uncultured Jatrophihabitans sp.]|uniref:DICT sensory domain-containing protein n=1 Tax=uncultured Jatrophihabitans sp. TaxID=1610747 RepID=UPI0035CA8AF1
MYDGLSITELASRTGVPAPTLRSWETRYGLPKPARLPGGHRRYATSDVDFVQQVVRLRESGLGLPAAIERAGARTDDPEPSIFAQLMRRRPDLTPQAMSKATLLALTRAVEDECCARAQRPALFTLFQNASFFLESRDRWRDLASTARVAVVFADFGDTREPDDKVGGDLLTVPIPPDVPLRREWAVVCESRDLPACVAGWEHPGQDGVPDAERRFEAVWSVDPRVVRDAAEICTDLAQTFVPSLRPQLDGMLDGDPAAASADLGRASGLLNRMVNYLEQSRR